MSAADFLLLRRLGQALKSGADPSLYVYTALRAENATVRKLAKRIIDREDAT